MRIKRMRLKNRRSMKRRIYLTEQGNAKYRKVGGHAHAHDRPRNLISKANNWSAKDLSLKEVRPLQSLLLKHVHLYAHVHRLRVIGTRTHAQTDTKMHGHTHKHTHIHKHTQTRERV